MQWTSRGLTEEKSAQYALIGEGVEGIFDFMEISNIFEPVNTSWFDDNGKSKNNGSNGRKTKEETIDGKMRE